MKNVILTGLIFWLLLPNLYSQRESAGKWTVVFGFGLQAHDKRLFDFPPKKTALQRHPGIFGTYQNSVRIMRCFKILNGNEMSVGLGLSNEMATFTRPFDKNYFTGVENEDIAWTNQYFKSFLQIPLAIKQSICGKFSANLEILPQFYFQTVIKDAHSDKHYGEINIGYNSTELNTGLQYSVSNRWIIGIAYRAAQYKKIDKLLFNSIIRDPRTTQKFEWYNPFKFWFAVEYLLK